MPSTIFSNQSQPGSQIGDQETTQINSLINQIMSSANPQATFNSMVNGNPNLKNSMNLINQYGNGDPKTAFMNYASQMGKNALAQTIMSKLGLQ